MVVDWFGLVGMVVLTGWDFLGYMIYSLPAAQLCSLRFFFCHFSVWVLVTHIYSLKLERLWLLRCVPEVKIVWDLWVCDK